MQTDTKKETAKVEHTPGPWRVDSRHDIQTADGKTEIGTADYDSLAQQYGWLGAAGFGAHVSSDVAAANARLIAASPELLVALKYARRFLNPADVDMAFIDAAIAKAEGK
jgi:hypothetical protein